MVVLHFLTETCLAEVDQEVVVDVLCADDVGAALLLHAVEEGVELEVLGLGGLVGGEGLS